MLNSQVFDFLRDLQSNNNREWFHANKSRYEVARKTMVKQMEKTIAIVQAIDPAVGEVLPKNTLFRINRDIRFSNDKSPYKTNFGGVIAPGGNKKSPYGCYYLHVEPDSSFLAGGIYCPDPKVLKNIREDVYSRTEEFKSILEEKVFNKTFNGLWGEKLVRPPKGFPADFPDVELLKFKHYTVVANYPDSTLMDEQFDEEMKRVFGLLKPLNDFLNRAVSFTLEEEA